MSRKSRVLTTIEPRYIFSTTHEYKSISKRKSVNRGRIKDKNCSRRVKRSTNFFDRYTTTKYFWFYLVKFSTSTIYWRKRDSHSCMRLGWRIIVARVHFSMVVRKYASNGSDCLRMCRTSDTSSRMARGCVLSASY